MSLWTWTRKYLKWCRNHECMSTLQYSWGSLSVYSSMMLVALAIDSMFGWPRGLYARIGHPVSWIGQLISRLDCLLNRHSCPESFRRITGCLCLLIILSIVLIPAVLIQISLPGTVAGLLLGAVLSWPMIAARSLHQHVGAVLDALSLDNIQYARESVGQIVGRDTSVLDESGISRAALESLAENTSDGIVAPIFWGAIFGLPGLFAYKAVNTLDSMIGHRNQKYAAFGWASAVLDDAMNYFPARLTGLLMAVVSPEPRAALHCMMNDARCHRSPNAGWPESSLAGALGVRLSGPRVYGGLSDKQPWLNKSAPAPDAKTIQFGLNLYSKVLIGVGCLLAAPGLSVLVLNQ